MLSQQLAAERAELAAQLRAEHERCDTLQARAVLWHAHEHCHVTRV